MIKANTTCESEYMINKIKILQVTEDMKNKANGKAKLEIPNPNWNIFTEVMQDEPEIRFHRSQKDDDRN